MPVEQKEYIEYINMKKDVILTVRVTEEVNAVIQDLANQDDRTVAWMLRKLLDEALQARGLSQGEK